MGPGVPVDPGGVTLADETSFVSYAGAEPVGALPTVDGATAGPIQLEGMMVSSMAGELVIVDWTDEIEGNELFVCGNVDFHFDLDRPVYSFGFEVLGPSLDGSRRGVLFEDDFESGLAKWTGPFEDPWHPERLPGEHYGTIVADPIEGDQALSFTRIVGGVDSLSRDALRSPTGAYRLTFDYLGLARPESVPGDFGGFAGFTNGLPGDDRVWEAGSMEEYPGLKAHLPDVGEWRTVSFDFTHDDDVHIMLEDFRGSGGVPGDAYFDNVLLEAISSCQDADVASAETVFQVTLLRSGEVVETHTLLSANDEKSFFGVWASESFDQVEIREIEGGSDPELFGRFFLGEIPRHSACVLQRPDDAVSCDSFESCSGSGS